MSDDREKLLQMARDAGFEVDCASLEFWRRLARFAELVRADEWERVSGFALKAAEAGIDKAMELEREACAQVCEAAEDDGGEHDIQQQCANAIRARGKQEKV